MKPSDEAVSSYAEASGPYLDAEVIHWLAVQEMKRRGLPIPRGRCEWCDTDHSTL